MRLPSQYALLLVFLALCCGCAARDSRQSSLQTDYLLQSSEERHVKVTVLEHHGLEIIGARVLFLEEYEGDQMLSATTDVNGHADFTGAIANHIYVLVVTAPGYKSFVAQALHVGHSNISFTVTLVPSSKDVE